MLFVVLPLCSVLGGRGGEGAAVCLFSFAAFSDLYFWFCPDPFLFSDPIQVKMLWYVEYVE